MVSRSPSLQARLSPSLKISSFEVKSRVLQSPLSDVTDTVFRRIMCRYAPDSMMYTEIVNVTGLHSIKELPNYGVRTQTKDQLVFNYLTIA